MFIDLLGQALPSTVFLDQNLFARALSTLLYRREHAHTDVDTDRQKSTDIHGSTKETMSKLSSVLGHDGPTSSYNFNGQPWTLT